MTTGTLQAALDRFQRAADDAARLSLFARGVLLASPEFAAASEREQTALLSLLTEQTEAVADFKETTASLQTTIAETLAKVRQRRPTPQ
jgi:hypothetical protein